MIDKEKIKNRVLDEHLSLLKAMERYQAFVSETLDWWEKNAIPSKADGFLGESVMYADTECICTTFAMAPMHLIFTIGLRPKSANKDIGSGSGMGYDIKFKR